ncbi:hypothetical protein GCK32_002682 [Trichostrongylus colubriformis]|uniref:Uncharacterized protein n=1 Tax=Trichostrongylus colubriformis TaxID=6319 RepID=A0AAN8ES04_TRICO
MGAEQSVENIGKKHESGHATKCEEKPGSTAEGERFSAEGGSTGPVSSADGDATSACLSVGSSKESTSTNIERSPSTTIPQQKCTTPTATPSTTPTSTADKLVDSDVYPFRAKVKHLSLEQRKIKYEEEIRRLFQSPHPSHITRLAPEKVTKEKADIPQTKNTVITWNDQQMTFDIGKGALSQRAFKRCNRSRPDPWRRYGALRKLHEIGGTGCTPPNQTGVRVQQKFYPIEAGSDPPPPPLNPPITTIDEYGTIDVLLNPKKRKSKEKADERGD